MTTQRKADWRLSAPHYVCGHDRTPENTMARGCRACHNRRAHVQRQRKRATLRRRRTAQVRYQVRTYGHVLDGPRPQRPAISLTLRTLILIETCREEYERATGQFELFEPTPVQPCS